MPVDIQVMSSNAMREALLELFPGFEEASGHKVVPRFVGGVDIMKRMAAGETCDLVIISGPQIDQLIQQGKVADGSRVDLVRSGVGIAVRAGAPRPDIGSAGAGTRAPPAPRGPPHSSRPRRAHPAQPFS